MDSSQITVKVELTAQLKRAAGGSPVEVELSDGSTLRDLAQELGQRFEGLNGVLINTAGEPSASVLVFVNDQQSRWDDNSALQSKNTVTLISPISGG